MEILVISHKYPPSIGGMQYHCFKLVEQLEKKHVVRKLIFRSNYPKVLFFLFVVVRALLALKKYKKINAVYVNDGLMAVIITPLLYLTRKPIIVTIHGLDISFPFAPYSWWIKRFLNKFHAVIAVSEPTQQLCIKKGVSADIVKLVKNAVDLNLNKTKSSPTFIQQLEGDLGISLDNKFILMSLGRGVPRKGHLWFTENVMTKLSEHYMYFIVSPEFQYGRLFGILRKILPKMIYRRICLLIGAELDAYHLPAAIKSLNLSDRVFFLPHFARDRYAIFQLMKLSDLFIMPNIKVNDDFEGFGLVALEASGSGLMTLAGDVDGIPSAVIHEKNGFLIEQGNAAKWTSKIEELSNQNISKLSADFQQYTFSMQFSWEQMTNQYVKVFEEAIIDSNTP